MFKSCSKYNPCSICGKDHSCSQTEDGLIFCRRTRDDLLGFRFLGETKCGTCGMYRDADDPRRAGWRSSSRPSKRGGTAAPPKPEHVRRYEEHLARARKLDSFRRRVLAGSVPLDANLAASLAAWVGLPPFVFSDLEI